ncbi:MULTISPECIES: hypothetical protein [Lactococcus]|nr:hypothetical protein [Lactococcus cremoris]
MKLMQKNFLKERIESGFEEERELLNHEVEKKERMPIILYFRPVYFFIMITATLAALASSGFTALKFFISQ